MEKQLKLSRGVIRQHSKTRGISKQYAARAPFVQLLPRFRGRRDFRGRPSIKMSKAGACKHQLRCFNWLVHAFCRRDRRTWANPWRLLCATRERHSSCALLWCTCTSPIYLFHTSWFSSPVKRQYIIIVTSSPYFPLAWTSIFYFMFSCHLTQKYGSSNKHYAFTICTPILVDRFCMFFWFLFYWA